MLQAPRRKRVFIHEDAVPDNAMTWASLKDKARVLWPWRLAVGRKFAESARVLRVAWLLEWSFSSRGFGFMTDGFLSRQTGIPIKKIQAALLLLEREGAIIRSHSYVHEKAQRRIWVSSKIVEGVPPAVGNMDTPRDGAKTLPTAGRQNTFERARSASKPRLSSVADAARRDAEIRERRNRDQD